MRQNRVRELRKARGWSVRELADRADLSHGYVVRIEGGKRGLSVEVAEKLANALEKPVSAVLGIEADAPAAPGGLSEDAEPYEVGSGDPFAIAQRDRDNVFAYRVKSRALDAMGIGIGDVVLVDIGQPAVDAIKALDAVIAQIYHGTTATTVLRQFVPPSLLITNNSDGQNERILHIEHDDVAIKGVVVGTFKRRG